MLRASGATAAALLLTSIVYAAPVRAADAVACDAAVHALDASGFATLAGARALLPSAPPSDSSVRRSAWLVDDDHDPVQQDDAPALGMPGAHRFAWSLEPLSAVAILADPPSRQHERTRWSPRGPPL